MYLYAGAYIKVHRIDPDRTIPDGLATRRLRHQPRRSLFASRHGLLDAKPARRTRCPSGCRPIGPAPRRAGRHKSGCQPTHMMSGPAALCCKGGIGCIATANVHRAGITSVAWRQSKCLRAANALAFVTRPPRPGARERHRAARSTRPTALLNTHMVRGKPLW